MASSVSELNNYSNFSLFSFDNTDLLTKGLLMKQGAIDENRAKLTQMREQVANFSIAKEEDKAYLEDRLIKTTDILNKYAGGDLSNPNLMNQLVSKFEDVVDDKVLNAVTSTTTRQMEDKVWAKKRESGEGYSDKNYAHQAKNWEKYMTDGAVGSSYKGGGGFVEYIDLDAVYQTKEFSDFLKNSKIEAEYIRREDGSGYFQAINTYDEIDGNRLMQAIEAFVGEKGKQQMQINAWGKYGDPTSEEAILRVKGDYQNAIDTDLNRNQTRLDAIDKYLEDNIKIPKEQKDQYEAEKGRIEKNIESLQSKDFNSAVTNPDGTINEGAYKNAYTSLYEQDFLQSKFDMLYHEPIWKDTKIDEVQFKTAEFLETKRMHDLDFTKEARLAEKQRWEMMGSPILNADGTIANPGGVGSNPYLLTGEDAAVTKKEADDIDIAKEYQREYQTTVYGIANSTKKGEGSAVNWDENSTIALEGWLVNGVPKLGETITLSTGRKLTITNENIAQVEKLKAMVGGDNATLRQLRNNLTEYQRGYNSQIDKAYKADPDKFANANLGDFYYVADEKGRMKYKEGNLPSAKGGNNFKYLMDKQTQGKTLTKEEAATLRLYKTKALMNDKDLTAADAQQLYRAYKNNIGATTANTLPSTDKFSTGKLRTGVDSKSIGIQGSEKFVKLTPGERASALEASRRNVSVGGTLYEGRTANTKGEYFMKQDDFNRSTFAKQSIEIDKGDYVKTYNTLKSATLENARQVINKSQFTVTPTSTSTNKSVVAEHNRMREALRSKLGLAADYKGDITFERVIKDGKPTEEFKVITWTKGKNGVSVRGEVDSKKMTYKDLTSIGYKIETGKFTPFDADLGRDEAATLEIQGGSNLYNKSAIQKGERDVKKIYTPEAINEFEVLQTWMRTMLDDNSFDVYDHIAKSDYKTPTLAYRAFDGTYRLEDEEGNPVQLSSDGISGRVSNIQDEDIPRIKGASDALVLEYITRRVKSDYNLR